LDEDVILAPRDNDEDVIPVQHDNDEPTQDDDDEVSPVPEKPEFRDDDVRQQNLLL